ncbi:MAG: sugar phosphate isomerase/epimerase [Pirellulaceae bacterium]|nr:sugar phosphate isomerase/epimerase [Pirellulaceae bacterium]
MARISVNEVTTFRWSFEEDVQNYAALGIPAIGVWRQKLSDYGEEKGVELLQEVGLEVSSLLWAGGFTGSDGRSHAESLADAREAIRLAAALRAGCLIVYSGARGGHTHNHARRLLTGALTQLSPVAAEFGVTLAIEPMHDGCAADWTFLTDLDETLRLLDQIDRPEVKLVFDCYHLGQDPAILDRLVDLRQRIAIVQLGDARQPPRGEQDRCPLGGGTIPLAELVEGLREAGYDGFLEVELLGEEFEALDYHEVLSSSKRFVESLISPA